LKSVATVHRFAAVVATIGLLQLAGCMRRADIVDEPDGIGGPITPTLEAGPTPTVDSGLGTDAFASCTDRPFGMCQGPVDFPCAFPTWVNNTASKCQRLSMCATNGWLRVALGAEGCVDAIGMDQPNDAVVRCLAAELGATRCPCRPSEVTYFFGVANSPDSGTCNSGPKG